MADTILVIDDDPTIVHLLRESLEIDGYQVLEGFDGAMALQIAKEKRPNLIIMDVNMPQTSGLMALDYLRDAKETKEIPIIFLTGESGTTSLPKLAQAARVTQLTKPIDLERLSSIVKEFIDKYPIG